MSDMINPYGYVQAQIDRWVDIDPEQSGYQITEVKRAAFHGTVHSYWRESKERIVFASLIEVWSQDYSPKITFKLKTGRPVSLHICGLLIFKTCEDCATFMLENQCWMLEHATEGGVDREEVEKTPVVQPEGQG